MLHFHVAFLCHISKILTHSFLLKFCVYSQIPSPANIWFHMQACAWIIAVFLTDYWIVYRSYSTLMKLENMTSNTSGDGNDSDDFMWIKVNKLLHSWIIYLTLDSRLCEFVSVTLTIDSAHDCFKELDKCGHDWGKLFHSWNWM